MFTYIIDEKDLRNFFEHLFQGNHSFVEIDPQKEEGQFIMNLHLGILSNLFPDDLIKQLQNDVRVRFGSWSKDYSNVSQEKMLALAESYVFGYLVATTRTLVIPLNELTLTFQKLAEEFLTFKLSKEKRDSE